MNRNRQRIDLLLVSTLKQLARAEKEQEFSGIGLLVYHREEFSHECHADLRPGVPCPENVRLGSKLCVDTLLDISDERKPLHDGFIFFSEDGVLTHISQYFAPIVTDQVSPNLEHGTRFRAAQYGSLMKGVVRTGIVSSNGDSFVFCNGRGRKVAQA